MSNIIGTTQGGISCGAIDESSKSSKAVDKRIIINFPDKNVVIAKMIFSFSELLFESPFQGYPTCPPFISTGTEHLTPRYSGTWHLTPNAIGLINSGYIYVHEYFILNAEYLLPYTECLGFPGRH